MLQCETLTYSFKRCVYNLSDDDTLLYSILDALKENFKQNSKTEKSKQNLLSEHVGMCDFRERSTCKQRTKHRSKRCHLAFVCISFYMQNTGYRFFFILYHLFDFNIWWWRPRSSGHCRPMKKAHSCRGCTPLWIFGMEDLLKLPCRCFILFSAFRRKLFPL